MLPLLRQGLFWADGVDRLRHHRGSTGTDCPCWPRSSCATARRPPS